jgi:predicted N-acetyltransferase YhbS
MYVVVRVEEKGDHRRVEEITREAFSYPGRIEQGEIGSPYEHWMVHELRKRDGIKELSLVAEADGQLAGHIICSNAKIALPDGRSIHVLNFGPVSVLPSYQRKGIGKALIHSMIDKSRNMGYGAIMFFGRPEYYPQFGFVEAAEFGVTDCYGKNHPSFMAMELKNGYLADVQKGMFYESDIYHDDQNREAVKEFDKSFIRS